MTSMNKQALDQAFKRAAAAHKAGKLAEAKAGFERIVKAVPNMAQARFQLARILLDANDPQGAAKHLSAARKSAPKQPPVWQLSAIALGVLGDAVKIERFKSELKTAPIPATVKAELTAKMAINRPPEFGGASKADMDALIRALVNRDGDMALTLATALDRKHPGTALIINGLASAHDLLGDTVSADLLFRRAILRDPFAVSVRANYARFLNEQKQYLPAEQHLRRATQLQPENGKLFALLADTLCETSKTQQAEDAAHKAVKLLPQDAYCQMILARACSLNGKTKEAEALFDDLIAHDRGLPQALVLRAGHYQQVGAFAASVADFIRAIDIDPTLTDLYYQLVMGTKFTAGDPLITEIEDRIARSPAAAQDPGTSYAMAKIHEDTKQYDKVFTYLRSANDALAAQTPWNHDEYNRLEDHIKTIATSTDLRALGTTNRNPVDPIFVTGLPRSGTTLTEQIIGAHSTTTGVGEAFWSRAALHPLIANGESGKWSAAQINTALIAAGQAYQAMSDEEAPNALRIVDKVVGNHEHIGLLGAAMPKSRVVVMKRDPRDNLLSIYKNRFNAHGLHYNTDLRALAYYYSRFLRWLEFWQELWPDSFHVLDYDELTADPEGQARKLLDYCDLPWEDGVLDFHKSDNSVRTLSVYQVRQPIYRSSVRSWERYADDLAPLFDALREFGVPLPD